MTMARWEPLAEFRRMDEMMDRLWGEFFGRPVGAWSQEGGEFFCPMDVYQTKDHVIVKAIIPGVGPDDLEVTFSGQQLTIRGELQEAKDEEYLLHELRHGTFTRTVLLPEIVDTSKAEAAYENGVLGIRIPKREEVKPRSLKVKVQQTPEAKKVPTAA